MKYLWSGNKKVHYQPVNKDTQLKLETDKLPVWCTKNLEIDMKILNQLLLARYSKRQEALNALMNVNNVRYGVEGDFFSNFINYFDVDVKCLCKGLFDLANGGTFHIRDQFAGGKAGKAYKFEMNGDISSLVIKTIIFKDIKDYLSVRTYSVNEEEKLINPANRINSWKNQKGEDKIIVVEGTDFSNQTCLHLILNTILQEIPNYIYQYDAFICRKDGEMIGYNIMEMAQYSLDKYVEEIQVTNQLLDEIVKQTLLPLSILKKSLYGFSHSDLKPKNIFVSVINGVPIFKIADYDKSSITWNSVRFYNGSRDVNAITKMIKLDNFKIKIDINGNQYYELYTRGGNYGTLQSWTMHNQMGVPLSYDFYTFMIITLLVPKIWNFIKHERNNIFTRIWEHMWYAEDLPIIMKYIETHYENFFTLKTKDEKKKYMDKMQSIGELNRFLGSSTIKFKYEITRFFEIAGINFVDDIIDKNNYFFESEGEKICYDKCINGKCKTNKYSSLGTLYESDNCKEK